MCAQPILPCRLTIPTVKYGFHGFRYIELAPGVTGRRPGRISVLTRPACRRDRPPSPAASPRSPGPACRAPPAVGSVRASEQTSGRHGRRGPGRHRCARRLRGRRGDGARGAHRRRREPAPRPGRRGPGRGQRRRHGKRNGDGAPDADRQRRPQGGHRVHRRRHGQRAGARTPARSRSRRRGYGPPSRPSRPTRWSSTWQARSRWSSRARGCGRSPAASRPRSRTRTPTSAPRSPRSAGEFTHALHPRARRPRRGPDRHLENHGPGRRPRRRRGYRGPARPPPPPRHRDPHRITATSAPRRRHRDRHGQPWPGSRQDEADRAAGDAVPGGRRGRESPCWLVVSRLSQPEITGCCYRPYLVGTTTGNLAPRLAPAAGQMPRGR